MTRADIDLYFFDSLLKGGEEPPDTGGGRVFSLAMQLLVFWPHAGAWGWVGRAGAPAGVLIRPPPACAQCSVFVV